LKYQLHMPIKAIIIRNNIFYSLSSVVVLLELYVVGKDSIIVDVY